MADLTMQEEFELERQYQYHAPTLEQLRRYDAVRLAAKAFERAVLENCPASADRTFACRQIRDARMTANRSIVLEQV